MEKAPVRHSKRKRFTCKGCVDVDSDEMVMCDMCDKWLHYRCAGVGPEIAGSYFSCRECKAIDKYFDFTDTYVEAKAAEKKIRDARKLAKSSQNEFAERERPELNPNQLEVTQEISVEAEQSQLDPDQLEFIQEINSATFVLLERPELERSVQLDIIQQIDQVEGTESLELAKAVLVEKSPESEPDVGLVPQFHYKLPIAKKKHIKNFNKFLKSDAILSAEAVEHSDCYITKDYKEMVRAVSKKIFSDEFLRKYSYCGQGVKKELRKYSKVIELIVRATTIKYPTVPSTVVLDYFKDEYVKYADRRFKRQQ